MESPRPESEEQSGSTERQWDYVIIVGNGGSGSKRLLHIFDQSSHTHCRNEPYNNLTSPFKAIREFPRGWAIPPSEVDILEQGWDDAVKWTHERMGDRDFLPPPQKNHLYEGIRSTGLMKPLASRTMRKMMGILSPSLKKEEWPLPWWAGSKSRLEDAFLILKFNQSSGLIRWVLENRPRVKVIHIVRHPAGCLNSWRIRHLASHPEDFVYQNNLNRLRSVAEIDPEAREQFGDIDRLSNAEAELLFWRYAALVVHRAGVGKEQYELVLDEQVVQDGVTTSKQLYDISGLEWEPKVAQYVESHAKNWKEKSCSWDSMLPEEDHEMIQQLLSGTEMEEWWQPEQVVSRIDYTWQS